MVAVQSLATGRLPLVRASGINLTLVGRPVVVAELLHEFKKVLVANPPYPTFLQS